MEDFSFEYAKRHQNELIQAAEAGHQAQLARHDQNKRQHHLSSLLGVTLRWLGAGLTGHKRGLDKLNYYSSNLRLE